MKPDGAILFFAQCPYDKVLGASNLPMLRYEWIWYKSKSTGFLNARRRFICFENAPAIYAVAQERITQARAAVAGGGKGV